MKYLSYILSLVAACSLFSCDNELVEIEKKPVPEQSQNPEGFYIAPEDTAGITVPDGYSLVVFPGQRGGSTRAAVSGNDNRITHLQYLIYKKGVGESVYTFYKREVVFNQGGDKIWPYKAITTVVPNSAGTEYKFVFLGNVDKSLFAGQAEELLANYENDYDNARIVLPGVEFDGSNMYYMGKGEFSVSDAVSNLIQKNVLLQRIVSRVDVTKEPFADAPSGTTYQDAYINRIAANNLWSTEREKARGGYFHEAVKESVLRYVMGLTYVATKNCQSVADEIFTDTPNKYSVLKYRYGSAENILSESSKNSLDNVAGGEYVFVDGTDLSNNALLNTAQYLYDLFCEVEGGVASAELTPDNDKLTALLNYFWEKVITVDSYEGKMTFEELCRQVWTEKLTSYVKKANSAATGTDADFYASFNPVRNCPANVAVTFQNMPASIDFNHNVKETMPSGTVLAYKLKDADDDKSDKYFSLIGLGNLYSLEIARIQFFNGTQTSLIPCVPKQERAGIWSNESMKVDVPLAPNTLKRVASGMASIDIVDRMKVEQEAVPNSDSHYIRGGIEGFIQKIIEELGVTCDRENVGYNLGTSKTEFRYQLKLASNLLCDRVIGQILLLEHVIKVDDYKNMLQSIANSCQANGDGTYTLWTYIYMPIPILNGDNLSCKLSWSIEQRTN